MKRINNEQGAALIYVIMISMVLTVFITGILMMASTTQLGDIKSEVERKVTNVAVSGLQALLQVPGTESDQLTFLKNSANYSTGSVIQLVEGGYITYRQYAVDITSTNAQALNNINAIPISSFDPINTRYIVVTTATYGDSNGNQIKDAGENSFFMKALFYPLGVTAKAILTYSFPQQTGPATIDSVNRTIIVEVATGTSLTNLIATFTNSPGTKVFVGTTEQASGVTANNFSTSTSTPFIYTITSDADGTTSNWTVVVTVKNTSGNGSGIVWKVDAAGNRTPAPFSNTMVNVAPVLVITSSVGTVTSPNSYDFQATDGIIVEPGVNISTTGSNATVSLASSAGSVVISSTALKSTGNGNSSPYDISINAALDIDIRGTTIDAQRNIQFTAGRKILASNATINSMKNNGGIAFTITSPTVDPSNLKIFSVGGLYLNRDAPAGTSGIKICGALAAGSGKINGFSSFTGGYCN